jgi:hypothetical protein
LKYHKADEEFIARSIMVAATLFLSTTTFWLTVQLQHEQHAGTVATTTKDGSWKGMVVSDAAVLVVPAWATADHPPQNKLWSRPYFVLHVGPQKTTTSALQCSLVSHQSALLDIGGGDDENQFLGKVYAQACGKNTVGRAVDLAWMGPFYEETCVYAILLTAPDAHA